MKGQAMEAITISIPHILKRFVKSGSSGIAQGKALFAMIAAVTPKMLHIPKLVEYMIDGKISVIR